MRKVFIWPALSFLVAGCGSDPVSGIRGDNYEGRVACTASSENSVNNVTTTESSEGTYHFEISDRGLPIESDEVYEGLTFSCDPNHYCEKTIEAVNVTNTSSFSKVCVTSTIRESFSRGSIPSGDRDIEVENLSISGRSTYCFEQSFGRSELRYSDQSNFSVEFNVENSNVQGSSYTEEQCAGTLTP